MSLTKALVSGFVPPCIPTRAAKPPSGPDWVHEIKHDGYRLQVRRDGDGVRLFTRRGYDWSGRYPAIAATAATLRAASTERRWSADLTGLRFCRAGENLRPVARVKSWDR
jgi:ATP-dependent DNA ligase